MAHKDLPDPETKSTQCTPPVVFPIPGSDLPQLPLNTMSALVALTLTLSPDNPVNTKLLNEDGKALYTVHTEHGKSATLTHVQNTDDEVLASLEWRDVLPDKVTLGSKAPMSLRDWLHTSLADLSTNA